MQNRKLLLYFMVLILIATAVHAYTESGQIALLTVSESDNSTVERGGVANLYLTIKPGTGRIFIDSFPLSKEDTQITTRFSAELACDFLDIDCSRLDFFYTIRANSAVVGGPSAGAASTVLTVALLDGQRLDDKTVMTGTINSGNLIGPVAGISAKTLAAQQYGFTKALIPKWDIANETPNADLKIKVIPVSTLEEALFEFTGKNYSTTNTNIVLLNQYTDVMKNIATNLCSKYGSLDNSGNVVMPNLTRILSRYDITKTRSNTIRISSTVKNVTNNNVDSANDTSLINISMSDEPKDFFGLAQDAMSRQEYYSAASFCFGGNVRISTAMLSNFSDRDLKLGYAKLIQEISSFEQKVDAQKITTISSLETYMVVKERILEARKTLEDMNPENISYPDLSYAIERFDTANIWSEFFNISGTVYKIDDEQLKQVCLSKISEVEERVNYLQLYMPRTVDRQDLRQAYSYYDDGQYALCIFTASKAKADVDVVLGALYVNEPNIQNYLEEKLVAAKKAIAKQEQHGIFPILGYSYYEYANALGRTDNYSALVYAENSLELSNLDMYFPRDKSVTVDDYIKQVDFRSFVIGFLVAVFLAIVIAYIFIKIMRRKIVNRSDNHPKKNLVRKRKK